MAPDRTTHPRRRFLRGSLTLAGLSLLTGCGVPPVPWQPPTKIPRIGFIALGARSSYEAFRRGLRDFGYVEGQNIVVEFRDAEGRADRVPELASELIRLGVELIVAAPSSAAFGVRQVSETMPIVVAYGDPVGQGLVASLARPGGNVTGLSAATAELSGKRLQLLKEALPGIARLAVLAGVGVAADQWVKDLGVAGRDLGVQLRILRVGNPGEFESAFAAMSAEGAEAVVVTPAPIFAVEGGSVIVDLAMKRRLPTMFETRQNVDSGGLMAYGPNLPELARRAATYVDKILKGAKPADLPVERPTTFDFVINLTTARTLGLTIPESVLQQATELIQ